MRIGAVIVNYNSWTAVVEVVSVLRRVQAVQRVVVVDNASEESPTRHSLETLRQSDIVSIIFNDENLGFARAANQGIKKALDEALDAILLINPDTSLEPGSVEELVGFMSSDERCGLVGPSVITRGVRVESAGFLPSPARMLAQATQLYRLYPPIWRLRGVNLYRSGRGRVEQVDWISGACMLVRSSVFDSVGLLCERWFMYAEDHEFCDRARRAGFKVVLLASTSIEHSLGASGLGAFGRSRRWIDAQRDYYRLRTGPLRSLVFSGSMCLTFIFQAVVCELAALRPDRRSEFHARAIERFYWARVSIGTIDPTIRNLASDDTVSPT